MTQTIKTQRLILRPFVAGDGPAVVRHLNDFEISKWLSVVPHPFTDADLRILNADGTSRWPDLMAIEHAGDIIGAVSAGDHFGFWIGRAHWGQGFASEAAGAALRYKFELLGAPEVQSGVFEGNAASLRVLEKLGFEETGRAPWRCAARDRDLLSIDFTLTRARWEARP